MASKIYSAGEWPCRADQPWHVMPVQTVGTGKPGRLSYQLERLCARWSSRQDKREHAAHVATGNRASCFS